MDNLNDSKRSIHPDDDPLKGNDDLVRMLQSAPEREWPDIAPRIMAEIAHRRAALRRRIAVLASAASAAAAAVVIIAMPARNAEISKPDSTQPLPNAGEPARNSAAGWLVSAQGADGTWNPASWGGSKSYGPAVTGFVIMSLAQHGDSHLDGSIARATATLRASQDSAGNLGGNGDSMMFNHAIATVALLRLYGTGRFPELFTPIDGAINYIRSAQASSGTWGEGTPESHLWLVEALAIASDLGWQDKGGQLRRGIMRLESAPGTVGKTLADASSLEAKKAGVERLCAAWLKANPATAAGGSLYAASVASL